MANEEQPLILGQMHTCPGVRCRGVLRGAMKIPHAETLSLQVCDVAYCDPVVCYIEYGL
jgi:hypothetical protein